MQTPEKTETLEATLADLPESVRHLVNEANLPYYQRTNEMHCDPESPGGSKFLGAANIFEVLQKDGGRIADEVAKRADDRDALLAAGAAESAFLPATKKETDPPGLPEALYYKVDGIEGKLGIIKLGELADGTPVLVRREKSMKGPEGKEQSPCSFTALGGALEKMPDTDFATVIVGREGGAEGADELWTIHPGPPIRAAQAEDDFIPGSESLPGPETGTRQRVLVVPVSVLRASGRLTAEDYIKLIPQTLDEIKQEYDVVNE